MKGSHPQMSLGIFCLKFKVKQEIEKLVIN